MSDKPTRCVNPVIKFCQECEWGWVHYPEWVETVEDLSWCQIESGCTLGYDQGRPEDEPTEAELREFDNWYNEVCTDKKVGYCPICDDNMLVYSNDSMCSCPYCGHHIALHKEE